MKYRRRHPVVDAQQWFPGVDIPGVKPMPDGEGFAYLEATWGEHGRIRGMLNPGQWVVIEATGVCSIVSDQIFRETFVEEVDV